ncbi:LytS/YhcK type 5TM receptor domain-containing protein [Effusibacillus lacus]|uniref:histidine kinase n=1 Tax=Effusibacillus lacus TaxID=1348429 RepID=A0A292YL36_9BACL|nr:LytS/YhcK type 5TM receptor domain-containing protein [Effusibacillus lacus]TCS69403.1 two-component system sensor histidine kinase LytS [Effusibacillus lacus]GAX89170.1 histidine kinase [Effusibacillus lacus]
MGELTIYLFERVGLLLILAFMLTRVTSFRYLLDRKLNWGTIVFHSLIFGAFAILGALMGEFIAKGSTIPDMLESQLVQGETLVGSTLIVVVIAGLLGGPSVGFLSGAIAGTFYYFWLQEAQLASGTINPIAGLLAGLTARFFSSERIIAPAKAMFIGMFPPIIHMGLLLLFTSPPEQSISLVNTIGLPLVVTSSLAIAIFTAMIQVAVSEQEQEAAIETQRALRITEEALPHLKQGLGYETAAEIAKLLHTELKMAAVSITDKSQVLAHIGLGSDHHKQGEMLQTHISHIAIDSGEIQIAVNGEQIQCSHSDCPLQAAILVPLRQSGEVVGLIKLYFQRPQQLRAVEIAIAQGLGKLISNQLDVLAVEKMKNLLQEMELSNLQAQVNPHFFFNTLHLISSLIRVNPDLARHIIVQLGYFMRLNLKIAASPLISLEQELEHLYAYIEIVKVRFADQLTIDCHIDEGIETALIPPSTLQPLVENSIKHGLKHVSGGGKIELCVRKKGEEIELEIRDNGIGIPSKLIGNLGKQPIPSEEGTGIGLHNVNQRLIGLLGMRSSLKIENLESGGCCVSFRIPIANEERSVFHEDSSHDWRGRTVGTGGIRLPDPTA